MDIIKAKDIISKKKFAYKIIGDGTKVLNQVPKPDIKVNANSTITLYTTKNEKQTQCIVPNILRMTLAQAQRALTNAGLNMKITGSAVSKTSSSITAISQSLKAGTKVPASTIITVEFRSGDIND